MKFEVIRLSSVPSTNTCLKELAKKGASHGTVVVAEHQTAGRGRLGRTFHSPSGSGLYLSILLRPNTPISPADFTCMAAVALCETAETYSVTTSIKWVNDLFVDGRKVAGILTEGALAEANQWEYVIIGIGVNLYAPNEGFPSEIRSIAGPLFSTATVSKETFCERLLERIGTWFETFEAEKLYSAYKRRLNCLNRRVLVNNGSKQTVATVAGLCPDFRLLVRTDDGIEFSVGTGEIQFL